MKNNKLYYNLHKAIEEGGFRKVPKKYLTQENLLRRDTEDWNCFHLAAYVGFLYEIPKEFLTEENLLVENSAGENVFHLAGWQSITRYIPKEIITVKTLLKENNAGITPLDLILGEGESEEDILSLLPLQQCAPYLKKLKGVQNRLKKYIPRERRKGLGGLIKKVETMKKLKKMPSLRIE